MAARPPRPTHAAALVAVALCSWGGAAAASTPGPNGIDALPPRAVLARSARALAAQSAVDVVGSIRLGSETVSFDLRSAARGRAVAGRITVRSGALVTGPVRFVVVRGVLYLDAPAAFWRQAIRAMRGAPGGATAAADIAALASRWISVGGAQASNFAAGFGGLTRPGELARSLVSGAEARHALPPTTVRGRRALPVTTASGATVYVALVGEPLPLEIRGSVSLGSAWVSAVAAVSYPAAQHVVAPAGALTVAQVASAPRA